MAENLDENKPENYFDRLSKLLSCVYATEPDEEEVTRLLHVLYADTDLTMREVAYAVEKFLATDRSFLHDVYGVASPVYRPDEAKVAKLRQALKQCGQRQGFDWTKSIR